MRPRRLFQLVTGLSLLLGGLLAPASVHACSVCMGEEGSNVAGATNSAIFLMLGVLFCMLGGIGAFIVCLARRARRSISADVQLAGEVQATP